MLVPHGTQLFGPHDRFISPLGPVHLATLMVHAWWLPVWPLGTFLILPDGRRVRVRTTARSLLLAYLSAWTILGIVVGAIGTPLFWQYAASVRSVPAGEMIAGIALSIFGAFSLVWTLNWRWIPGLSRATQARRREIETWLDSAAG